ncbi:hypothetical protein DPMN_104961 [Dreissena polymorpha]|uniref:Uncharacterized protein n=1 Tax=Dreissena polymorpha TaxID=45954 RepID=A0A9D4H8Q0_DREPO|nr:hypothetical protein DPMN_104961 [Dreissena polymorpha]
MTVHVVRDILQMCVMLDQCETQLQIFTRDPSPLLKEAPRSKQIEKPLASYNQIKSTSPVHAPTMPNVFLYPVAMLYPVFSRSNDAEVTFVLQTIPSAPTPYMLNKPIPNIEAASPSLTYSGKMSQQMMFRADERFNIQTTTSSTDPDGGD